MRIENLAIRIKTHAWHRYCTRVEQISLEALYERLYAARSEQHRWDAKYLQLGDIWWRASVKSDELTLHTCYGRTTIDLPEAIRWAKRHNDRIHLGGEVSCDVPENSTP